MSVDKKEVDFYLRRTSIVDRVLDHVCTPVYQPTNKQWEVTFRTLGWDRNLIEDFWAVFCRINKSRSGEITIFEFLNYFNLDRSGYVEQCFNYFDTTGGDSVDFLEFIVSVWNICTMKVDTLTNFTFDIYDLDADGQLSLPEIELMVLELYGTNSILTKIGNEVLQDVNQFAEERGGVLDLNSFTMYTMNHSLLLFPIFRIQRTIQKKILGMKYWNNVENSKKSYLNQKKQFNPRHVQILLRTYKTGAAAAFLTHTGDVNVALRENFIKEQGQEEQKDQQNENEPFERDINDGVSGQRREAYKYEKLKRAVEKIQVVKANKTNALKKSTHVIRTKTEKTVDMATQAFLAAGRRAKTSYSKSQMSKLPSKLNSFMNDMREKLIEPDYNSTKPLQHYQAVTNEEKRPYSTKMDSNMNAATQDNLTVMHKREKNLTHPKTVLTTKQYIGRTKKKMLRPRSAPHSSQQGSHTVVSSKLSRKYTFDHRKDQFKQTLRPRTPGSVYTIDEDGGYTREESNSNN